MVIMVTYKKLFYYAYKQYMHTFLVLLYELYIHALSNGKLLSAYAYERHAYTRHYKFSFTRLRWQTVVTMTTWLSNTSRPVLNKR